MMDFDEMLIQVGEFGLYQKALFVFQAPFCMFVTFVLFGQLFMTLYPMTIWCDDHFACTHGNMSPFQKQNFSFSYQRGAINHCFMNNIHASFIKGVADWSNGGNCPLQNRQQNVGGNTICNYTEGVDARSVERLPNNGKASVPFQPLNIAQGYGSNRGNQYQYQWGSQETSTIRQWGPQQGGQTPQRGSSGSAYGQNNYNNYNQNTQRTTEYSNWGEVTTEEDFEYHEETSTIKWDNNQRTTPKRPNSQWDRTTTTRKPNEGQGESQGQKEGPVLFDPSRPNAKGQSKQKQEYTFAEEFTLGATNESRKMRDINCTGFLNVTMNRTARIFLVPLPNDTSSITTQKINTKGGSGQTIPMYLSVASCRTIAWNRSQSGVPYNTIVTEGGATWWCNAETYITAAQAVFFLGAIVGGFLIGYIADNYGRVPALVIANLFGAIGGALSVVSTNFWLFMFFRFITGMAFDNCFTMMYILVLEFCGPTYRTLVANLSIAVFYTLGTLILPWLALLIGNWQIYGLAISLPMLSGLLAIFLVPESARWLLSKGRASEATNILRSFAKVNGKQVDDAVFTEFERDARKLYEEMQEEEEEQSFTAALKTPRLRRTFILLTLIWSLIALVYDGHSRNILNLADETWDVFWMFTIASMTEFPADMLLIFTLDKFGRRWLSFGALTMSGAFSIIAATIPRDMRTIGLVLAITSRFFVNVAFNIGLQYAAELLPTVIRAQGVNAIHIMGYVASIISPFVAAIGRTNPQLSLVLLGGAAIAGGCLSLFLSETLGEDLPNTLEEAEAFGINQSFWNCPICAKSKDDEHMPIEEAGDEVIRRRNNLRSTMRGEALRSSIISSGSRASRLNIRLNPGVPTETTKLRRITH